MISLTGAVHIRTEQIIKKNILLSALHPWRLATMLCINKGSDISPEDSKVSNQCVLAITCAAFALFVIAEIIGALAGHSLSLLGDAAAMSVDVFSYLANMYAEYLKDSGHEITPRQKVIIEVLVPSFSVCALIGVTIYVVIDAIAVIIDPSSDGGDDVNVLFLFCFAGVNMAVDILSALMFYCKGKEAFITAGNDSKPTHVLLPPHCEDQQQIFIRSDEVPTHHVPLPPHFEGQQRVLIALSGEHSAPLTSEQEKANLNMISAFTHVTGDTFRTISIFVAAVVATVTDVPGNLCDAWAAVIVAITILFIVFPLIIEIYKAARKLQQEQVAGARNCTVQ